MLRFTTALLVLAVSCGGPADVTIENGQLSLRIGADMRITPSLIQGSEMSSIVIGHRSPPQSIRLAGGVTPEFTTDAGRSQTPIETVHGGGQQVSMWATSDGKLKKQVDIDLYDRYPHMAVFRTRYTNGGTTPITVEGYAEVSWTLDGADLWAFHPRNWTPGEDFLFPVTPDLELAGNWIAARETGDEYRIHGGGLPAVSYMSPRMTLTIGYLSPKLRLVAFPIKANGGQVSVGLERELGLGEEKTTLEPGETLETIPTFINLHHGDYYEGVRVMSLLHQDLGLRYRNPAVADVTAPGWSNRGIGNDWDKRYILDRIPELQRYGIKWIHMGDPWQDNLGDYGVSERFSNPGDLGKFITRLNREGFRVTAFFSDLVVDCGSRVAREHMDSFVQQEDGSPLRVRAFGKSHYVLCPAYAPARRLVGEMAEKLAADYGFHGVKNDGHTMPFPCFHPAHRHEYPEQSVEDYPLMQKAVYEAFERQKPESFVVAFCFDGVVPLFYQHQFTTRPWPNADQTSEQQARWKQKLFKAIFGPQRVLLDDHSDAKYLSGKRGTWYLGPVSGLAMGSVPETVMAPGYDHKNHHYDEIFEAYHRERLPEGGEYLDLYHVVFDKPECHVVRKGDSMYYGFFAESFDGTLELRGLENGTTYHVVEYLHGLRFPDVTASGSVARLDAAFKSYLLLRLTP